jgi:tetratricopeptide (TPR) repeat protein
MEAEAIRATAKQLNRPIAPGTARRIGLRLTNNLTAWKLLTRGRKEFDFGTREGNSSALQCFNEALQLDPDYIDALSAKALWFRVNSGDRSPKEIWSEIKACAERILQIDPTSSDGQTYQMVTKALYEWDRKGSYAILQERRARNLDWPVQVACCLRVFGLIDEARVEQEKVKLLDQRNHVVRYHVAAAAFVERNYRKTVEEAQKTQEIYPGYPDGLDWLAQGFLHLGKFDKALEAIRKLRSINDGPVLMAIEAFALVKKGEERSALKILSDLQNLSRQRYIDPYPLAWVYLALGDRQKAFAALRQACEDRSELLVFADSAGDLRRDPKLDELRGETEFRELLKKVGFDEWVK